jgi:hypothetical protein
VSTHAPPQSVKPALHANPHAPAAHVALALAGAPHGEHELPQCAGLLSDTHAPEHA